MGRERLDDGTGGEKWGRRWKGGGWSLVRETLRRLLGLLLLVVVEVVVVVVVGRGQRGEKLSVRSWDESANTEEGEERRENTRTLRRNKGIQVCED